MVKLDQVQSYSGHTSSSNSALFLLIPSFFKVVRDGTTSAGYMSSCFITPAGFDTCKGLKVNPQTFGFVPVNAE